MTVKINGVKWSVRLVDREHKKLFLDGVRCLGVTYFDKRRGYIDKELSCKEFKKTAVHELTHAYLYACDIDLKNPGEKIEEILCGFWENYGEKILQKAEKIDKKWKLDMAVRNLM